MPDSMPAERAAPPAWRLVAAFGAVYLIWGSTYLALAVAVDTLPPYLMNGLRFLLAGAILYALTGRRRPRRPTAAEWRSAALIGGLMMVGATGTVGWAEQTVPSGVAALLVICVPMWVVLIEWLGLGGPRPTARVVAGLALAVLGILLLVGPAELVGLPVDPVGALAILAATLMWSLGTVMAPRAPAPADPLVTTAMRMLAAGPISLLVGTIAGEWRTIDLAAVSTASLAAVAYLIVFGSIVVFSAYYWLLGVTRPQAVATYAYVNPIVAVALGAWLLAEPLGWNTLLAATLLLAATWLVAGPRRPGRRGARAAAAASAALRDGAPAAPGPSPAGDARPPNGVPASPGRLRQHPERGRQDRATIDAILDEGMVCHVGIVEDGRPVVIPMAYARDGDRLILHGAAGSRLMQALAAGAPACATVTLVDGLVLARSAFHHSLNYRSVVVHGRAEPVEAPAARRAALDRLLEHLVPGRGAEIRRMDEGEVAATAVVALPLDGASAKLREGPPLDAARDRGGAGWAGVLPLRPAAGPPVPEPGLAPEIPLPPSVRACQERHSVEPSVEPAARSH